ncbi:hypothetical protein QJS04_geneDACA011401 [Acorus gramineus]|uniref:Immediate early response 3-interacting protein 1 n=1 Tax=Acorus gramineus TaxID=55184 RepID=A0AAV9AK83_ACOGR|nr:hypothetical protein QJS04_geneDACA011401 [Acorus gramineus]
MLDISRALLLLNHLTYLVHDMSVWRFLEGRLLLLNALVILSEDRFLGPRGWGFAEVSRVRTKTLMSRLIGLIYAAQYMRVPLIALNIIFIFFKLVSG